MCALLVGGIYRESFLTVIVAAQLSAFATGKGSSHGKNQGETILSRSFHI